ncbi:Rhamnogalacturonyl hydrolase YesR [Porphyromonadaceae bacterium KH3R12]|nr:Rhamnogalacturonyl hydrolase YesR [Porphyromonadaceae bacterium KH3R12]
MKKKYFTVLLFIISCIIALPSYAQKKSDPINDFNTPLHLLQPDYAIPYGIPDKKEIKSTLDRILTYLDNATPATLIDNATGREINLSDINHNSGLKRGDFRLASYEWGVTYAAMLAAAEATGDKKYEDYVFNRFQFLSEVTPEFRKIINDHGTVDPQIHQVLVPKALDDAGAMCAAMIKAGRKNAQLKLEPMIRNYMNYIMYNEYRLYDGTFARKRPQMNTVWLDDMFMSIPALAQMGAFTGENRYFDEAARQISLFADKMFVWEKGLFRHGWVESMQDHPSFFWGRANGWALLTLVETLDILPEGHPQRETILQLLRMHIKGIAAYQSGDGFWHQLLDRNNSYYETSATAIFTYCIAHSINKGWIDALTYGPAALLGWNAVSTKINSSGQVEGTCVGTGMAFDHAFYYYRPTSVYAAHGYGPVIWAGAEVIRLLDNQYPKMNDNAVQFYSSAQTTTAPIFSVNDATRPDQIVAGSTRKSKNAPVVMLIGDSTMKNGRGKGENGQWGWGSFFEQFFDTTRISVENHALGGRSSRTFYTEGLWDKVLPGIQKGDYLFIQFGHNDGGPLNTGRARASLKGIGDESQTVIMERNGGPEEVFTFGHYLRIYIRQAKTRGAIPIVLSHTPGNTWDGNKMVRNNETYGKWSREVAEQEGVLFIDMNDLIATKCETLGKEKTNELFKDRVHTSYEGAILNCEALIEGIETMPKLDLRKYIIK